MPQGEGRGRGGREGEPLDAGVERGGWRRGPGCHVHILLHSPSIRPSFASLFLTLLHPFSHSHSSPPFLTLQGSRSKSGAVFTIGVVGRCLSKTLVEGKRLVPKCRELVLVAAPKDARSYFDYPESTSALVQRVADMQKAAGLNGLLVDARGSAVTVTGWVALACIVSLVVVIIGGACTCLCV